ncbi:hypothetical protein BJX61DRAFT_224605 [Aspergillus egyptiacus]|nr:hypothetical protein BJX61DRAFT_224605 [Aspergillus egyptiacus]
MIHDAVNSDEPSTGPFGGIVLTWYYITIRPAIDKHYSSDSSQTPKMCKYYSRIITYLVLPFHYLPFRVLELQIVADYSMSDHSVAAKALQCKQDIQREKSLVWELLGPWIFLKS